MKAKIKLVIGFLAVATVVLALPGTALAKYKCKNFSTCEEAMKAYKEGATYLDRDKDGVPCESLCR